MIGGLKGRTNVIGALLKGTLLTVCLFQTTVDALVFNTLVTQDLMPKLPEKSIIVMDNATFHKSRIMQKCLPDSGHIFLYLPPYSPDFSPKIA